MGKKLTETLKRAEEEGAKKSSKGGDSSKKENEKPVAVSKTEEKSNLKRPAIESVKLANEEVESDLDDTLGLEEEEEEEEEEVDDEDMLRLYEEAKRRKLQIPDELRKKCEGLEKKNKAALKA